jgi:hypothetical protein
MREWLLTLIPVALVFYFVIDPDQFSSVLSWMAAVALSH